MGFFMLMIALVQLASVTVCAYVVFELRKPAEADPVPAKDDPRVDKLMRGLLAVEQLVASSVGVAGLSGEGDQGVTPWAALDENGPHYEWLAEYHRALRVIDDE